MTIAVYLDDQSGEGYRFGYYNQNYLDSPVLRPMHQQRSSPVNVYVGNHIRLRRSALGMSMHQLAGLLGLTFQQIQKYEMGVNRLSAGRLFTVAKALGVPVSYFYGDLGEPFCVSEATQSQIGEINLAIKFAASPQGSTFVLAFSRIKDRQARKAILILLQRLGENF